MIRLAGFALLAAAGGLIPALSVGPSGSSAAAPDARPSARDPEYRAFLDGIPLDPRVQDGLRLFREGSPGPLPPQYVVDLPMAIRLRVVAAAAEAEARLEEGTCDPSIEVTYPGKGFPGIPRGDGNSAERFEDSFVRVEMIACFRGTATSPAEALALYTSPEFRMEASGRIREIVEEDGLSCIHTDGVPVLLDPSRACNRITEGQGPGWAAEHSQVVVGESGSGFQPTFFKESLKTFVQLPDGIALHYVNYTRSTGLNGLKKRIGRGKAADSQREQIELLAERVGATLR